jgi:putative heme iron utilization protein
MSWLTAAEYFETNHDPLADASAGIIKHMNTDHGEALILLARAFAGIEAAEVRMISVDRLGFRVQLKMSEGIRRARIAFSREVTTPPEARAVFVQMTQEARRGLFATAQNRLPGDGMPRG